MLTYELAKELKDAGFSQLGDGHALILDKKLPESDETITQIPWALYVYKPKEKAIYVPTLSELIEACGDSVFFDLVKFSDGWLATDHYMRGEGATPEEAVANLWLGLNKK